MASSIGSHYRCSVFGESHGKMIGIEIDGVPPGEAVDENELQAFMARRAPGNSKHATKRKEPDIVHIASGIMDGVTTGFPLMAYIENTNQHSKDYSNLLDHPRPSHADYTAHIHYKGFADMRGGGHFSGRLTAPFASPVALPSKSYVAEAFTLVRSFCKLKTSLVHPLMR